MGLFTGSQPLLERQPLTGLFVVVTNPVSAEAIALVAEKYRFVEPSGTPSLFVKLRAVRTSAVVGSTPSTAKTPPNWLTMCRDERGAEYIKSVEISPEGIYKVERLTDAIEHYYLELRNSANPTHLVASGWIAIPDEISMDEAQAAKLFYAAGAWHQVKVAA